MASIDLTDGTALQQFLVMGKNAKGKACVALIQQVLSAPNVFVFGEFLDLPNTQHLQETEDKKYLDLLRIFAYGTYSDYKANAAQLPQLTPGQTRKLQQLTIVSLSCQSRSIPYSVLQKELDITEVRELEDLIIDAIYQGVIQGKLDQKSKQLDVESAIGRDIKPESLDNMLHVLTLWGTQAELLLKTIKEKVNHANLMNETEKKQKEEFEKRVENVKTHLKAALEDSLTQADYEGMEFLGEGERNRKGRSKMKHRDHPPHPHHRDKRGV